MTAVVLKDPVSFATAFVDVYAQQGFQSLGKRDLDLLVFLLFERDGAVARDAPNFDVARQLRLTPAKVKSLRREAYARWRPLVGDDRRTQLQRVLSGVLTEERIASGAKHAAEKNQKEGFLAVRVEHPDDREELEQAILEVNAVPVYERNRDVLAVRFDTLLAISEKHAFAGLDTKKFRSALQQLAPASESLQGLLKKNVKDITWQDMRQTFNALGAEVLTGALEVKATSLLKLIFPFLS